MLLHRLVNLLEKTQYQIPHDGGLEALKFFCCIVMIKKQKQNDFIIELTNYEIQLLSLTMIFTFRSQVPVWAQFEPPITQIYTWDTLNVPLSSTLIGMAT